MVDGRRRKKLKCFFESSEYISVSICHSFLNPSLQCSAFSVLATSILLRILLLVFPDFLAKETTNCATIFSTTRSLCAKISRPDTRSSNQFVLPRAPSLPTPTPVHPNRRTISPKKMRHSPKYLLKNLRF